MAAAGKSSTIGTFLELKSTGPGRLIGSGHPDQRGTLPGFLGLIASNDAGRSWRAVSRLGDADLHKIVLKHDRLYAFDAVLGAMLISPDGGRTFDEQFTPRGLIIDFEVDPDDPKRIFAANESALFRSENGGKSWRASVQGEGIRLDWPAPDAFYRAEKDGTVQRSRDGGGSWERVGTVPAAQPPSGPPEPPAPGGGATPPLADKKVSLRRRTLIVGKNRRFKVAVNCPATSGGRCVGTLRIESGRTVLAKRRYRVTADRFRTVSVRLTKARYRALKRKRKGLKVTVSVLTRDAEKTLRAASVRVTLRAKR